MWTDKIEKSANCGWIVDKLKIYRMKAVSSKFLKIKRS